MLPAVGRPEVQAQCRNRSVQFIDDSESLRINGSLERVEDRLHGAECQTRDELPEDKISLGAFDRHLPDWPLLTIQELEHLSRLRLHN
jgi:hypothetical protein